VLTEVRVCLCKLRRDNIVLILTEVQVKHRSRARCVQAEKSLRVCNLRELLKDCCRRECTESKRFKYLEVFEELPQGVRARIFPKGLEDFSTKFRRDRIFEVDEEKLKKN
jgi:hypothetical protein